MDKAHNIIKLYRRQTTSMLTVACLFLCVTTQNAFSFTALRPAAVSMETGTIERPPQIVEDLSSAAVLAEEMKKYIGFSTSLPNTVVGKAAFLSTYSAYDILRHIEQKDIKKEKTESLPKLTQYIKAQIENENLVTRDTALTMLAAYQAQIENYLEDHLRIDFSEDRLIRNSIGALAFFLSIDLRKARVANNTERAAILKGLLERTQAHTAAEIDQETLVTQQDAAVQWNNFTSVRDGLIRENNEQINACERTIRELSQKIEALSLRNNSLTLKIAKAIKASDNEEEEATQQRVDINTSLIAQCEAAKEAQTVEKNLCKTSIMVIKDISKNRIKGPENMEQQQRTLLQILYTGTYRSYEKMTLDIDPYQEGVDDMHRWFTDVLRRVETVMARLTETVPLYLKTSQEHADLVLFSNHEIPVEALNDLLELQDHPIKAIVCFEGSIIAHWVIVAQSKGIPVIILRSSKYSAEEIVSLGENVIVETATEQDKDDDADADILTNAVQGTVIVSPDKQAELKYGLSSLRQELYLDLCKQQYVVRRIENKDLGIKIYANAADVEGVKEIADMGIEGTGLYRTEVSPGKATKAVLAAYVQDQTFENEKLLLDAFKEDMYACLNEYKEHKGPFVMRTDDFEEDKNIASVIEKLGAKGFDLYKTDIGKGIVTLRVASYYIALDQLHKEGGYAFKPTMIFPMIKEQRDVYFMREEIMPQARKIAVKYIGADDENALMQISTGPMVETIEACDNIDDIIVDPKTSVISVGNSDLTASVLSRESGLDINRSDSYFSSFFMMLQPSVCEKYIGIAEFVARWNRKYPNNTKVLGFCGAQTTSEDFILFACALKRQINKDFNDDGKKDYIDVLPMYFSVPPKIAPLIDFFVSHIIDEDLKIFEQGIGFKTQQLAHNKVKEIHARIKETPLYKQEVEARLKKIQRLGIAGPEQDTAVVSAPRANSLGRQQKIDSVVNSAA